MSILSDLKRSPGRCVAEDSSCDRAWFLEQVKGAAGVLLMFPEKVWTGYAFYFTFP